MSNDKCTTTGLTRRWVVRQGCKGGMYLWGLGEERRYSISSTGGPWTPSPEWGEQGGATRYKSRVQAIRDAKKAHGRIVKIRLRYPEPQS